MLDLPRVSKSNTGECSVQAVLLNGFRRSEYHQRNYLPWMGRMGFIGVRSPEIPINRVQRKQIRLIDKYLSFKGNNTR